MKIKNVIDKANDRINQIDEKLKEMRGYFPPHDYEQDIWWLEGQRQAFNEIIGYLINIDETAN